jgi:hypothetical protein
VFVFVVLLHPELSLNEVAYFDVKGQTLDRRFVRSATDIPVRRALLCTARMISRE